MVQIEKVLGELDALEFLEALKPQWEESLASFPDGVPDFLQPEQVRTNLQWCGFGAEYEPVLIDAARKIASNRSLQYLAWHYYRMVYDYETHHLRYAPLQKAMGDDWPIFYLLIALALVPRIRTFHRRLGIPEQVTRECCLKVKGECDDYHRGRGRLGIFNGELSWLKNYVNGELFFCLGRFEFWSKPFPYDFKVYRSRKDGKIMALAGPAWKINSSGWIEGIGAETEDTSFWQTTLKQIGSSVYGFPINPMGFVEHDPVVLTEGDWECVIEKGMPILEMHIPAGERVTLERCAASFREAKEFFQRYFPTPAKRAIVSSSWMFSPLLKQLLPADSNLMRFMRELYLCPADSSSRSGPWFVFLQEPFDPATAPRDTSLQRAILNHLQAGNLWRDGSMFFMLDDLDHFGSQWYQKPTI